MRIPYKGGPKVLNKKNVESKNYFAIPMVKTGESIKLIKIYYKLYIYKIILFQRNDIYYKSIYIFINQPKK